MEGRFSSWCDTSGKPGGENRANSATHTTLEGPGRGRNSVVPNRLVNDVPCRAFQRGWFHQTRQNWRVWWRICPASLSVRGTFTKRFWTTALGTQKGIQAVPNVTRQELKLRRPRAAKHVRKSFVPNIICYLCTILQLTNAWLLHRIVFTYVLVRHQVLGNAVWSA